MPGLTKDLASDLSGIAKEADEIPAPSRTAKDLEEFKLFIETTAKEASEISPMVKTLTDLLESQGHPSKRGRDKDVYFQGWDIMARFISHSLKMDQINLDRHLETTNRLIELDKSLKRDMKEVKTASNKQAIIQPTTWATVAGGNTKAPVLTAGGTMTMVNKTTVQKKLNQEAELCSRQVIVDLKALVSPEDLTKYKARGYTADLLVEVLQDYDSNLTEDELKSARVMQNHVGKPYMVEFFDKADCDRGPVHLVITMIN